VACSSKQRTRQTPTLDTQPDLNPPATIAVSAAPVILEGGAVGCNADRRAAAGLPACQVLEFASSAA
jgi:hypothetical protein